MQNIRTITLVNLPLELQHFEHCKWHLLDVSAVAGHVAVLPALLLK